MFRTVSKMIIQWDFRHGEWYVASYQRSPLGGCAPSVSRLSLCLRWTSYQNLPQPVYRMETLLSSKNSVDTGDFYLRLSINSILNDKMEPLEVTETPRTGTSKWTISVASGRGSTNSVLPLPLNSLALSRQSYPPALRHLLDNNPNQHSELHSRFISGSWRCLTNLVNHCKEVNLESGFPAHRLARRLADHQIRC
jgi:hypothetical protein